MSRRRFLGTLAVGATALGCGARPRPPATAPRARTRAIAFDLFTLFDPRGVDRRVAEVLPAAPAGLASAWRTCAFEYAWIRAASGRYADFHQVLGDALDRVASSAGLSLDPASRASLIDAFQELDPWPDSAATLERLRREGRVLAPLANYTPAMIEALLRRAGLRDHFDEVLSTDVARTFKPHPRAYALGVERLGLDASEIVFAAFGGWDAAGARWFGYPTFWVNRLGLTAEVLVEPDGTGPTVTALADWVAAREA